MVLLGCPTPLITPARAACEGMAGVVHETWRVSACYQPLNAQSTQLSLRFPWEAAISLAIGIDLSMELAFLEIGFVTVDLSW